MRRAAIIAPAPSRGGGVHVRCPRPSDRVDRRLSLLHPTAWQADWNAATASPITESDVRRAIPAAQIALDNALYEVRIQRATDGERRYMRAMAELGSGPYRAGQIAKLLARKTSDLSVVRQRLLEKGLVYATEDHGYLDFTVPRFDEFMRRHMSFDR